MDLEVSRGSMSPSQKKPFGWSLSRLHTGGSMLAQRWRIDRFSPLYELLERKRGSINRVISPASPGSVTAI